MRTSLDRYSDTPIDLRRIDVSTSGLLRTTKDPEFRFFGSSFLFQRTSLSVGRSVSVYVRMCTWVGSVVPGKGLEVRNVRFSVREIATYAHPDFSGFGLASDCGGAVVRDGSEREMFRHRASSVAQCLKKAQVQLMRRYRK